IKEIAELKERYGIDFFYFSDDMFGLNKRWMEEWFKSKRMLDKDLGRIPYGCQTRADVATEDLIGNLKESGCIQLDVGVESGDQEVLDKVNKKISIQQIRQTFEWCRKYRLRAFGTLMVNMPGETEGSIGKTKSFLKEIRPCGVAVSVCTPYPGTQIYDEYVMPRLRKEEYHLLQDASMKGQAGFRMAAHGLALRKLRNRLGRKFKVLPMFERMWTANPLYWKTVACSGHKFAYALAWIVDLPKTFLSYWRHRF
ncbi:MAG: radical SAM protein, partial [Pseudomonadota bacterium]